MGTAQNPAELVRDARDALKAAEAAEVFIAGHPGLPVARMHACGVDAQGQPGPLLEVQLEDNSIRVATAWARAATGTEPLQVRWLHRVEHRASVQFAGVTVLVTAFEDAAENDDREPCGESGCICYGAGPDHVDCACGCDCPRDDYGQLIHEG